MSLLPEQIIMSSGICFLRKWSRTLLVLGGPRLLKLLDLQSTGDLYCHLILILVDDLARGVRVDEEIRVVILFEEPESRTDHLHHLINVLGLEETHDLFPVQANVCTASRRIMVVRGKRGHLLFGFTPQN